MVNKIKFQLMVTALLFFLVAPVIAQSYPAKSIRVIVPSSPGDASDVIARLVALRLSTALGQAVIVENRPGAGGVIGSQVAAKSTPDGYTLIMGNAGSHGINAAMYAKLPYDIQRDFVPISQVAIAPNVMVIDPAIPAKSLAEFVAYAKSQPGKLWYGSGGNGTSAHLSAELFKSISGLDIQHVPFKGSVQALGGVMGGQVAMFIGNMPPTVTLIKAGKLRALAVTTRTRSALMPELPTISEAGFASFETVAWFGVLAPAGTPPEIVTKLGIEIAKIARTSDMRDKLMALGAEPIGSTPSEFKAIIDSDIVKWKALVQKQSIAIE